MKANAAIFRAIFTRILFLGHGTTAVYLYAEGTTNRNYWFFLTPLVCLLFESMIAIACRQGQEYRYFWPSGCLYISCFIPMIWNMELDEFDLRSSYEERKRTDANFTNLRTDEQEKVLAELFMDAIDGRNVTLRKICELGLVIGIIAGRWLMPRGEITRDQLSALLLLYVGNAADILELFAVFEEPEIINNRNVLISVLFVFTWSMYQFSLVATAQPPKKKEEVLPKRLFTQNDRTATYTGHELRTNNVQDIYIKSVRSRISISSSMRRERERGKGKKNNMLARRVGKMAVNEGATNQKQKVIQYREVHGETFQILVTLLMQDGPYLILRLYLMLQFDVTSEMHIFFTCKNAFVCILLTYRLLVLSCSGRDEEVNWHREDAVTKLHNIQVALENMKIDEVALNMAHISVK